MSFSEEPDARDATWKDAIVLIVLRLVDAGLAPWVAVALFFLATMWLCLRNLDSKDTLSLVSEIGTMHGLSWIGWVVAFVQIPIFRWAINREKNIRKNKMKRLEDEHAKALELLRKNKLDELRLEG